MKNRDYGKVAVIVVTYNRLNDLANCIDALRNQTYKNLDIIIVNNGSNDGTREFLEKQSDIISIHQDNTGGAGGFHTGMRYMMEQGYDWLVMMDDDGVPDVDEVKNLVKGYEGVSAAVGKEVILNALVVDKDNHERTAFIWARGSGRSSDVDALRREPFFNDIHPFNGTLVSRDIIQRIGLIKKEMFIWGDEKEYMARAVHNGIGLYTLTSAIHYHPKEKGRRGNIIPFVSKYQILLKPYKMSHYYYRNEGFIYGNYPEKHDKMFPFCVAHIIRFITHFEFGELWKFMVYFRRGIRNEY